jgi:hypothetical protein
MSTLVVPSEPRPFRALVRRDLGVAAPIALTAVALVALAVVALAGLPLLGRDAADALAVSPSSGLLQRLALLPDLLRLVLLLLPGWCAAAMAVADGQHRLGALGAALPVDAATARRARAAALVVIGAPFAVLLAVQAAATPDDATHVLLQSNVGTLFVFVVLGSIAHVAWAIVVGRACRHVPMACASATVAAAGAFAMGIAATWGALLLVGWVVDVAHGLRDLPPRFVITTVLDVIRRKMAFGLGDLRLSGGLAASVALGWALVRSLRRVCHGGRPRAGDVRPASIAGPVIAFLTVTLGFGIAGVASAMWSGPNEYWFNQSRLALREARELQALPAGEVLERFVTRVPWGEQLVRTQYLNASCSTGLRASLGIDPFFALTNDPVLAAVIDAAERQPAEVRAAAAAIAEDTARPLAARLLAASWLGPAAAAEFAVRELPRAKDEFARWLVTSALAQTLFEGAMADWHAVATGAARFPPIGFAISRAAMADECCGTRLHALIMLQLLRWQAEGTHRTSIANRSLGVQFVPTLTVPEIDTARRVLEQPLPAVAAGWRAALAERAAASAPDVPIAPDPDPFDCLGRPLSALLDLATTDPSWLAPPPAPK